MAAPPSPPVYIGLLAILSESKRIIKAHSGHFQALSVLFLLPISISSYAKPAINQLFCQSCTPTIENNLNFLNPLQQQQLPVFNIKTLIFNLLYNIFISIFTLLATGSITYSVFHGFYGRPVKLASAIKSAFTSFFRLVSTCLISNLIVYGLFIFVLVLFSLIMATLLLGFQFNSSSPYLISLYLVFVIILVAIVTYLQVNWTFAYVIVVVESSWGFEPLKRSQYLVKGLKRVAFAMVLFFWFIDWIFPRGSAADKWENWAIVLNVVGTSAFIMLLKLYTLAATTVFYTYSKAIHGELAWKITEEFAGEYINLPIDDAKVPNVASVPSLKTSV